MIAPSSQDFQYFKKQTLIKLQKAIDEELVDSLVLPIIKKINNNLFYITTSSCAGRIILMEIPSVGDKKNALMHGKWHHKINVKEIKEKMILYKKDQLWFIAQSPIFHIACENIYQADFLLKIGIESGFKHSGFKSTNERIVIELLSTERMDVPIGIDGEILIDDNYLDHIVKMGNNLIQRGQEKLEKLLDQLEK